MSTDENLLKSPLHRSAIRALDSTFGSGHYSTKAAYRDRFSTFERFAASHGIDHAKNISQSLVDEYVAHVLGRIKSGTLAESTAVNMLSCMNVVLKNIVGDSRFFRAPSHYLPTRTYTRTQIPGGLDLSSVAQAYRYLTSKGHEETAVVILMLRVLGLRRKEGLLQDYARMHAESANGYVVVIEGTKNGRGRYVERRVPISPIVIPILERAARLQSGFHSLIPEGVSYRTMLHRFQYRYDKARKLFDLRQPRDLRAAYACDRYQAITGVPAPLIAGRRIASKEVDRDARLHISRELGHARASVCKSYVGDSK